MKSSDHLMRTLLVGYITTLSTFFWPQPWNFRWLHDAFTPTLLIFQPKTPVCRIHQEWLWSGAEMYSCTGQRYLGSTTLAVRSNSGKSHGCPWSICCVRSPRTGKQGDKSSVVVTQQQSTFPWDSAREYFGQGRALSNRNVIRVPATKINLELLLVDLSLSARACVPFPFFRKKKIFPSLVTDKLLHSCCILPSQAERLFI